MLAITILNDVIGDPPGVFIVNFEHDLYNIHSSVI